MIHIHKEGYATILVVVLFVAALYFIYYHFLHEKILPTWLQFVFQAATIFLIVLVLQFFRNPDRKIVENEYVVLSPADGKVVVIEETEENEYFKDKRLQVSIFMSVWDVHSNRWPISGEVTYFKHHDGKYLIASNPKSSSDNEHTTIAVKTEDGYEIMFRQIAGFVARRIVCPVQVGDTAKQGRQFGFIKFGSRVDMFFPIGTKVRVKLGDKVKAGLDIIADVEKKN